MLFTSKLYLRYLKQINKKINVAQDKVEKSLKSKDIVNLMDLGKSLTYFSGYLQSNQLAYLKIGRMSRFKSNEDDRELLEDVIDENLQAQETVKIYSQIVQSTIGSYANLISNNLNENVKFLTSFTIILMMPTLIASIYGMNIVLPFQDHPLAFLIVTILAIIFTILLIAVFFRKKLF
jgi:magnesium transporter